MDKDRDLHEPTALTKENLATIETYDLDVLNNIIFKRNQKGVHDLTEYRVIQREEGTLTVTFVYSDSQHGEPNFSWGIGYNTHGSINDIGWFWLTDKREGLKVRYNKGMDQELPTLLDLDYETEGRLGKSIKEMTQIATDGSNLINLAKQGHKINFKGYKMDLKDNTLLPVIEDCLNSSIILLPQLNNFFGVPSEKAA